MVIDETATPEAMRHAMVASQLRTNAVDDPRVVLAMASVPRETFVPSGVAALAYRDTAVPLGGGRMLNVPMATGRLLARAALRTGDRVLLIGAAGGYAAAVLSRIVAEVTAVESDPALAAHARQAMANLRNVRIVEAAFTQGEPAGAPYDLLMIDGAVEHLPDALVAQVAIGGRAVSGLDDHGVTRLASGLRTGGGFSLEPFADSDCVTLPGFARPRGFRF